ncbi:MAG: hypothetical protein JRH10_11375 [Deltaproteobacteria bacterium]|nr:hypothetical protein [Deltaproteobacteria bacterium]MBW2447473.1 hypothetical protein [Deltaproteobacteria bacterium]
MNLFIATPCYGGVVTRHFMLSMIALNNRLVKQGIPFSLATIGNESLITRARNSLVARFLAEEDATHLLFIDADIAFEPEVVLRLMAHGGPVVATPCAKKTIDWAAVHQLAPHCESPEDLATAGADLAIDLGSEEERFEGETFDRRVRDGFVRSAYAGTGMMLVARPVFEALEKEFPELAYVDDTEPGQQRRVAFFDTLIHPRTGRYLSEDYAFCHRWRSRGGEVWLDTESQTRHEGSFVFEVDTPRRVDIEARRPSGSR